MSSFNDSPTPRDPAPRSGTCAGALAGAAYVVFAAHWVETGASVGWASFGTDGVEVSTATKATFILVGGLLAATVGGAAGALASAALTLAASRWPRDPHTKRLVARLTATWVVAALPLIYVATEERSRTYTREMPKWTVLTGVTCSLVWLLVGAARAAQASHTSPDRSR